MKLQEKIGSAWKRLALAAAALGSFMAFPGVGTAAAHPRVAVGRYPAPAYNAPRPYYGPVYGGPRYEPVYHRGLYLRYWDARFHCWRYR